MKLISVNQQKQPQTQRLGCEIASDIIELKMQEKSRNKFAIMASIFSVKVLIYKLEQFFCDKYV